MKGMIVQTDYVKLSLQLFPKEFGGQCRYVPWSSADDNQNKKSGRDSLDQLSRSSLIMNAIVGSNNKGNSMHSMVYLLRFSPFKHEQTYLQLVIPS
jgi:hypothetical protein